MGYVAACSGCGCRMMLAKAPQPIQGKGNHLADGGGMEPPPPPPPLWPKILLAIAGVVTAVVLGIVLVKTLLSQREPIPVNGGGSTSSASVSASASGSESGSASQSGSASESSAPVVPVEPEEETETERMLASMKLGPVDSQTLNELPDIVRPDKDWYTKRKVQGVEWNTDTMDTVYFCIASYIIACDPQGNVKKEKDTDGYLFSMDYYDGYLFCTWRSPSYGKFKLKVLDAKTLKELNSVDLADMHEKFERDEEKYGGDLCASIDGVVVAPKIGSQDEMMVYVSYNSYVSADKGKALNAQQVLYEYSYKDAIFVQDKLKAKRKLSVDLGAVKYGIQTLEVDRSTGNIWCAIRQGGSDYSLYCLDGQSPDGHLKLVYNGDRQGWDCPQAGDGLTSLGHDQFYVLIPYYNNGWISVEAKRVSVDGLEDIN